MNPVQMIPFLSVFAASPASAPPSVHPSFDCAKANLPDEKSICRHDKLAQLDSAIAIAAKKIGRDQIKRSPDNAIDYLGERRNCGSNAACILDAQVRHISTLNDNGARIPVPGWIGSYRLFLLNESARRFVNFLPVSIGTCTKTKIVGMTLRSGDPLKRSSDDNNFRMSIEYDDWGFQVSSKYVADVEASTPGDDVVLCLDAIPKYCSWNEHVKIYSATNLRTKGSWIMPDPDAKHVCEKGA